jgi:hypothetical protein
MRVRNKQGGKMLYVIFDTTTDETITTVSSMKEVNDWLEKGANYSWQPAD